MSYTDARTSSSSSSDSVYTQKSSIVGGLDGTGVGNNVGASVFDLFPRIGNSFTKFEVHAFPLQFNLLPEHESSAFAQTTLHSPSSYPQSKVISMHGAPLAPQKRFAVLF